MIKTCSPEVLRQVGVKLVLLNELQNDLNACLCEKSNFAVESFDFRELSTLILDDCQH